VPDRERDVCDGALTVHTALSGDTHLIALRGELDLANAETARAELRTALDAGDAPVLVDLRELEFIDSAGIALLVGALHRDAEASRLRFLRSEAPAVSRVLRLTGVEQMLPRAELRSKRRGFGRVSTRVVHLWRRSGAVRRDKEETGGS
jgi:anti-anti-sigma factor